MRAQLYKLPDNMWASWHLFIEYSHIEKTTEAHFYNSAHYHSNISMDADL